MPVQQTFEHLLGLRVETALAILSGYGVTDVSVVPTEAPARPRKPDAPPKPGRSARAVGPAASVREPTPDEAARAARVAIGTAEAIRRSAPDAPRATLRDRLGGCFQWGKDRPLPDALMDETTDDTLLSARVVAVRDDGRTLVVSRFHVGDPPRGNDPKEVRA